MLQKKLRLLSVCSCCLLLLQSYAQKNKTPDDSLPRVDKEFRAAWVATVANANWPSKPGLSSTDQQKEAIEILDFLKDHHFNAVIFQVRPQADALYQSNLEPWSYFLSGTQGVSPTPYYDPLQFWITEAHARGLELHVWLNPYRAHHVAGKEISDSSIVKKHPELVMKLKEGYWWMDPAQKATQDLTSAVVNDIIKRYDVDGVHFDDYFYPYPSYNGDADFPDDKSWAAYQQSGGKLSRGDWRRESVNTLIERLYKEIKKAKSWVKFGLSPFGIWRPGYPASVSGFDQYDKLYADAKLWLNKGWLDYFAPQLYWPINKYEQSYPVLLGWWSGENTLKRHLWPGISVGRDTTAKNAIEVINEIQIARGMLPESRGVVHWSIASLTKNPTLAKALLEGPYRKDALVPASPWLDNKAPEAPNVNKTINGDSLSINWTHVNDKDVFRWVVYYRYGTNWNYQIVDQPAHSISLALKISDKTNKQLPINDIIVTAVDRTGNESSKKEIKLTEQ
ncbi:glycoside hydrolase family 10 protein [Chitinophagaceae bacterium LWZ2-11]